MPDVTLADHYAAIAALRKYNQGDVVADYAINVPEAARRNIAKGVQPFFNGEHGAQSRAYAYKHMASHLDSNPDVLHPHGVLDARDLLPY